MNNFIDNHFFFVLYILGIFSVALFDPTAITDNVWIFLFISPLVAITVGAATFFGLVLLRGIFGALGDIFRFLNKKYKIF